MGKKSAAVERVETDQRNAMIAEAAYFKAESRDFAPGQEVADWLAAEREVEVLLATFVPVEPRSGKRNGTGGKAKKARAKKAAKAGASSSKKTK